MKVEAEAEVKVEAFPHLLMIALGEAVFIPCIPEGAKIQDGGGVLRDIFRVHGNSRLI